MAFHRFIKAILRDEEILLYGDGEQSRDFTFVSDAVEGTLSAAFSDSVGRVFNIGGGCRVTVNQVIKTLGRILQREPRVRYLESQKGDAKHTAAEIQAASAQLGYKPRVSLEEGLCLEAAWARYLFEGTNF
jgi:UDP-glucose 4-epimerase